MDTSITVFFREIGYDLSLLMNIKDNDNIEGSLSGKYDAEGELAK